MEVNEEGSDCANDLMLLERVFLRLGNADTDEKLQNCLNKFLPPVILKLSSPHDQVRSKVMELLVHINKRVNCRGDVQLPVTAIVQQYKEPNASTFVINFAIIYITMGFPRLPKEEQLSLAPQLLEALPNKPQRHQDKLLILLLPLFDELKVGNLELKKGSALAKVILNFSTEILLLPYRSLPVKSDDPAPGSDVPPPGMSMKSYKRVTSMGYMTPEELEKLKVSVVKFISNYMFENDNNVLPLIIASADSRFSVTNEAQSPLARISSVIDWSSNLLGMQLFYHYVGTMDNTQIASDDRRMPACTRLRLKLLDYINRLTGPAIVFPHCIKVIFTSLFDEATNARLKNRALQFLLNVINEGDEEQLKKVSKVILTCLLKLVRDEEKAEHHPKAFIAIGRLAARVPGCLNGKFKVLEGMMKRIVTASPELKTSLRDALLDMANAYKLSEIGEHENGIESAQHDNTSLNSEIFNLGGKASMEGINAKKSDDKMEVDESPTEDSEKTTKSTTAVTLVALIKQYLGHDESIVRYIATRYAAIVFPSSYIPAKFLLLLASGDRDETIVNEALKCLYGTSRSSEVNDAVNIVSKKESNEFVEEVKHEIPAFQEMVEYIWDEIEARKKGSDLKQRFVIANQVLPFHPKVYENILRYLRMCLNHSAGLSDCSTHPNETSPILGDYIRSSLLSSNVIDHYLTMITALMSACPEIMPLTCFLDVIGCVPEKLAHNYTNDKFVYRSFIKNLFITSSKEDIRETAAIIYAIITVQSSNKSNIDREIDDFVKLAMENKSLETQCGYASAFTHLCERSIALWKKEPAKFGGNEFSVSDWSPFRSACECIALFLKSTQNLLVNSACSNIITLSKITALPLVNSIPEQESRINAEKLFKNSKCEDSEGSTKFSIVEGLFKVIGNAKFSSKIKEKAIHALGTICCGERFPFSKHIVRGFLDMSKETKEFEIHLEIGEALVLCVEGINSKVNRDMWTELPNSAKIKDVTAQEENDELLQFTLTQLLTIAKEPHPNSKQATSVWLLALLKNCSERGPIKNCLTTLQITFMDLLSENSEIVQDVASKGLSLVYQNSPESQKQGLVGEIIDQLTSGRRTVAQVAPDTKIFEEGALGSAPTGGNLSTYKELCSLASDLNQPDLLYKFMHLAHHNSVWNSKKGAAFGFQSLALTAGEQLTEHLPKIVPRLYRYRYDPTPKIQNSMTSIWRALVPETQKTVQKYYKEILDDIVANLTASQWRVRMSCCNALIDLLREGNLAYDYPEKISEAWLQIFRVLDDVHEQTRKAAGNTAQALSKVCVRASDASAGKKGKELVAKILPVLLETGITHIVKEVRNISLVTVSKLVESAGATVGPFVSQLVPALCAAAGELEPVQFSYVSARLSGESDSQRALDTARASAARDHYTVVTCVKCLPYIDMNALNEMLPKMLELTKSPQLGTKVACCHMFVLLCHNLRRELEPIAGKIMAALLNGSLDRNAAVRQSFCEALGEISAYAKTSSIEKLMKRLVDWYETKDDEISRTAIALTLKAVSKANPDLLRHNSDIIGPVVFLAKHTPKTEDNESMIDAFDEAWESLGGNQALKNPALAEATLKALSDARAWTTKIQAAKAISTLAGSSGGAGGQRVALVRGVLAALRGKFFEGKEHLLAALASLCKVPQGEEPLSPTLIDECITALVAECRKRDLDYKKKALLALADAVEAAPNEPTQQALQLIGDLLQMDERSIEKDSDDDDSAAVSERREKLVSVRQTAYEVISRMWPKDPDTQEANDQILEKYESIFLGQCLSVVRHSGASIRLAALSAAAAVLNKLNVLQSKNPLRKERITAIVDVSCNIVESALGSSNQSRFRREALKILNVLISRMKDLGLQEEFNKLKSLFESHHEDLSKDMSYEVTFQVDGIMALLK